MTITYECVDCGHKAPLHEMHHRSHGGFDCPKCYGEVEKEEDICRYYGVDEASPDGDYSAEIEAEVNPDGTIDSIISCTTTPSNR